MRAGLNKYPTGQAGGLRAAQGGSARRTIRPELRCAAHGSIPRMGSLPSQNIQQKQSGSRVPKTNPNELMMKSADDWVWTNDSSRLNRARDWRNLGERPTRIFSSHLGRAIFNLIRGSANSCYAVQCALKSELPVAHSLRSWGSFFAVLGASMRFQFWS
jgi:hypothetical protein